MTSAASVFAHGNVILTWNVLFQPTLSTADMFGQGNGGHTFNAVPTDTARKAIIEYLKAL